VRPRMVMRASWITSNDAERVRDDGVSPPLWYQRVPISVPGFTIDAWWGPGSRNRVAQDAWIVSEFDGGVVLAVADGCTPTERTPPVAGDGALFAATTVLGHLARNSRQAEPHQLLKAANRLLLDRFGPSMRPDLGSRDRPQAAVAVAVIRWTSTGEVAVVDAALAADCDVWVRRGGSWSRHAVPDMFAPEARAAIESWDAANRNAPLSARFMAERRIIDDPVAWACTAVGRFDEPKFEPLHLDPSFDELVIATDGADIPMLYGLGMRRAHQWPRLSRMLGRFIRRRRGRRLDDVALLRLALQSASAP
jgi:hypothetical protein